jgi:hypothetical protein
LINARSRAMAFTHQPLQAQACMKTLLILACIIAIDQIAGRSFLRRR